MSQQATTEPASGLVTTSGPDTELPTPSKGLMVYFIPKRALMGETCMTEAASTKGTGDQDSAKPGGLSGGSSSQIRGSGGTPTGSGSKGASKQRKPYTKETTFNPRSVIEPRPNMVNSNIIF